MIMFICNDEMHLHTYIITGIIPLCSEHFGNFVDGEGRCLSIDEDNMMVVAGRGADCEDTFYIHEDNIITILNHPHLQV